jgi:hypothetical protein
MTTYKEVIVDALTGEQSAKDYTAEQIAETEAFKTKAAKIEVERLSIETAKNAAQAKLAALGLTTDDLKALGLGSN